MTMKFSIYRRGDDHVLSIPLDEPPPERVSGVVASVQSGFVLRLHEVVDPVQQALAAKMMHRYARALAELAKS